jgi:hypothetical protein
LAVVSADSPTGTTRSVCGYRDGALADVPAGSRHWPASHTGEGLRPHVCGHQRGQRGVTQGSTAVQGTPRARHAQLAVGGARVRTLRDASGSTDGKSDSLSLAAGLPSHRHCASARQYPACTIHGQSVRVVLQALLVGMLGEFDTTIAKVSSAEEGFLQWSLFQVRCQCPHPLPPPPPPSVHRRCLASPKHFVSQSASAHSSVRPASPWLVRCATPAARHRGSDRQHRVLTRRHRRRRQRVVRR